MCKTINASPEVKRTIRAAQWKPKSKASQGQLNRSNEQQSKLSKKKQSVPLSKPRKQLRSLQYNWPRRVATCYSPREVTFSTETKTEADSEIKRHFSRSRGPPIPSWLQSQITWTKSKPANRHSNDERCRFERYSEQAVFLRPVTRATVVKWLAQTNKCK